MELWYKKIKKDISQLPEFIDFYEHEYVDAKQEVRLLGSGSLDKASASLPHIVEHRFSQLQDIESVLRHLNIQYEKLRSEVFQKWFENQKVARALSARECEKYVDSDPFVNAMAELINDTSLLRNMYLAIMKGLDQKSYQIGTISRLRVAGLSDAEV